MRAFIILATLVITSNVFAQGLLFDIAKSNSGEYITLTPRAEGGSHVELFYCPFIIFV